MPSPEDSATLQSIFEGVDYARAAVEREWGCERLPMLVDDVLRARFRRQQVKFSALYQEAWHSERLTRDALEAVESAAGGMKRAYAALASAAVEAGHRPLAPWIWEVPLADGVIAALVEDNDSAAKVEADGRFKVVYTVAEIGNLISVMLPEALQVAKLTFPGARISGSLDRSWIKSGDPIPFGDEQAA